MDADALQAILDAPAESYDLSMLKPLKDKLKQAGDNAALAGDARCWR